MPEIRLTKVADVSVLPSIERSAGAAFRVYPELSWVADDSVMSIEDHQGFVASGTSWVASSASTIVGFLCAEAVGESELHIWELAVHADAQGSGVGTQLMQHAMAYAASSAHTTSLTLTTFSDVAFNAPFYRRLGFELVEELEVEPRLQALLREEAAHGLPIERRCAMRCWV